MIILVRHFHISYKAPYLNPPPPKFCITCFSFLLGITAVSRDIENNVYAIFFFCLGGGGGGQIRCIMGHVEVAYRRLPIVLDTVYNFYLRHIV